jgi:hypothetical protein
MNRNKRVKLLKEDRRTVTLRWESQQPATQIVHSYKQPLKRYQFLFYFLIFHQCGHTHPAIQHYKPYSRSVKTDEESNQTSKLTSRLYIHIRVYTHTHTHTHTIGHSWWTELTNPNGWTMDHTKQTHHNKLGNEYYSFLGHGMKFLREHTV